MPVGMPLRSAIGSSLIDRSKGDMDHGPDYRHRFRQRQKENRNEGTVRM
jgi:hypothetical protein